MVGGLTPGGDSIAAPQPGAFWAKITGNAAGTNRYAWEQIDEGDTAAFDVGLADSFAAVGTSDAAGAPAYEINGLTGVETGTRVLLHPAGDMTFYVFAAPATSNGKTPSGADSCAAALLAGADECMRATVVSAEGLCGTVDATQSLELTWDSGSSTHRSGATAWTNADSTTGQIVLNVAANPPTATVSGASGRYLGCSGDGGLLFAWKADPPCATGTATPCGDHLVLRFDCECCSIAGWGGEGWYCVREAGTEDPCAPQLLTEDDRCDDTIEICDGPFETEAEAEAECPPAPPGTIDTLCCPDNLLPETLYVTFGGVYAGCTATLTWNGGLGAWIGSTTGCSPCGGDVELVCTTGPAWLLSVTGGTATMTGTCAPLSLSGSGEDTGEVCAGIWTATVSATP